MKAPKLKEEIRQLSELQKKEKHLMRLPESNKFGVTNPYTNKCREREVTLSSMYHKYYIIKHNLFKLGFEVSKEIQLKVFSCYYSEDYYNKVVKELIEHETEESTEEAVRAD